MKPKNQLKAGVILAYVSTALNIPIQIIYTPIMIRLLGQSEYGLYTLVGSVVSYLSLFSLGYTGAYLRFATRAEISEDRSALPRLNGMFLTLFLGMGTLALVCGLTLSQFARQLFGKNLTIDEIGKAQVLMRILVVNISLTFPLSILDAMIGSHERFFFQRLVILIGNVCNPLIGLPLLLLGYRSVALVAVTTFITVFKLLIDLWYCIKILHIPFCFHHFEFRLLKEIGIFSLIIFANMIIDQINLSVDNYILGRVSGTISVAIYGVGSLINTMYYHFSTMISSVFAPRVNRIATGEASTRDARFTDLFIRVGRVQFIIMGLILTGFIFFGKYFVNNIYSTKEYEKAYWVAFFLMCPSIITLIQNIGVEIQRAMNKHKFITIVYSFMAIGNVLLSIPMAKHWGPVGATIGTAISLVLGNGIILNIYYYRCLHIDIPMFWRNILSVAKGLLLPICVGVFITTFIPVNSSMHWVAVVLLYTTVYGLSMWLFGMDDTEKKLISKPLQRFKAKIRF